MKALKSKSAERGMIKLLLGELYPAITFFTISGSTSITFR